MKPVIRQSGTPISGSKFKEASQLKKSNGLNYVLTLFLKLKAIALYNPTEGHVDNICWEEISLLQRIFFPLATLSCKIELSHSAAILTCSAIFFDLCS